MNMKWLALIAAVVSLTMPTAAQQYEVWNTTIPYNWLMDRGVSSSWGTIDGWTINGGGVSTPVTGNSNNGYGSTSATLPSLPAPKAYHPVQASLCNAQRVWIPRGSAAGTNGGVDGADLKTYYAQLDLGAVRPIGAISVATFYDTGMWYDKMVVQFSNTADFSTLVGSYVLYDGSTVSAGKEFVKVPFLDQNNQNVVYNAQYVRVVFPEGHYGAKNTGYGGPGLMGIEPYSPVGAPIEINSNFNLALNAFSGKTQSATGFNFGNGSTLGNGDLRQNNNERSGTTNWTNVGGTKTPVGETGDRYLTVELNQAYMVDAVRIVWNDGAWLSNGLTLEFSKDGTFTDMLSDSFTVVKGDANDYMLGTTEIAAYITFAAREAKYVRWVNHLDATNAEHSIAQEFMVYGQIKPIPEPLTLTLLAAGGLATLRRRK